MKIMIFNYIHININVILGVEGCGAGVFLEGMVNTNLNLRSETFQFILIMHSDSGGIKVWV